MNILAYSLCVIFRPADAFYYIKRNRERAVLWPPLFIIALAFAVRIAAIFAEHYPLAYSLPEDTTIILEAFIILAPILTWTVACFITTSVMNGESTYWEILTATAYCLIPYIIFTIPLSLFSNILTIDEQAIYVYLIILKWLWIFILILTYEKTMNTYTMGKTLSITFLSLVFVILIWAVIFLLYLLTNQFIDFIKTVTIELRLLFS